MVVPPVTCCLKWCLSDSCSILAFGKQRLLWLSHDMDTSLGCFLAPCWPEWFKGMWKNWFQIYAYSYESLNTKKERNKVNILKQMLARSYRPIGQYKTTCTPEGYGYTVVLGSWYIPLVITDHYWLCYHDYITTGKQYKLALTCIKH